MVNSTVPYADLRVKIRSYEKDGQVKNVYQTIGTLFASPHFSNMYIQLDALPINQEWDGKIYVNPREKQEEKSDRPLTQHEVLEAAKEIPF